MRYSEAEAMEILADRCERDEELEEAMCYLLDHLTKRRGMWASAVLTLTGQLA